MKGRGVTVCLCHLFHWASSFLLKVPLPSILEPAENCSPPWKDEAIQNGNIYPPSQHCFSSSLVSLRVLCSTRDELPLILTSFSFCLTSWWMLSMTWLILFRSGDVDNWSFGGKMFSLGFFIFPWAFFSSTKIIIHHLNHPLNSWGMR